MTDGAVPPEPATAPDRPTSGTDPAAAASRTFSTMDEAFLTAREGAGELILVRHGQQDYPKDGVRDLDRWRDPPLSERGVRQAEAVGRALAARPVDAVFASHLQRAYDTGEAVAAAHGVDVVVDPDLREIGMFQDVPAGRNALEAYGPEVLREAQARFVAVRRWDVYPGSETGAALRRRVVAAVDRALAAHPAGRVVVACHGGVINAYLTHVLGLTDQDMFFRPAHASVHRVTFLGERRVIDAVNETAHLVPADELLTF